ncbi:MAG TPA: sarcosine oxidase subunit delta [Gemmatimonadaceae bacterium]|nr:sarcosine oxidase subunit delta [Gemmatimonadaceae bacterium]
MLQITCPWCGAREETEFRYGGEGMAIPAEANDAEWARVLYYRSNPAGACAERWIHVHGCRQWFHVVRNTLTHEIIAVRPPSPEPERPS